MTKIGVDQASTGQDFLRCSCKCHSAQFEDVTAMGNGEGTVRTLFDKQHGKTARAIELGDVREYLLGKTWA